MRAVEYESDRPTYGRTKKNLEAQKKAARDRYQQTIRQISLAPMGATQTADIKASALATMNRELDDLDGRLKALAKSANANALHKPKKPAPPAPAAPTTLTPDPSPELGEGLVRRRTRGYAPA